MIVGVGVGVDGAAARLYARVERGVYVPRARTKGTKRVTRVQYPSTRYHQASRYTEAAAPELRFAQPRQISRRRTIHAQSIHCVTAYETWNRWNAVHSLWDVWHCDVHEYDARYIVVPGDTRQRNTKTTNGVVIAAFAQTAYRKPRLSSF